MQGSRKTLILREVNEESVTSLLGKKDALTDCDVAAFVYDRFELTYLESLISQNLRRSIREVFKRKL